MIGVSISPGADQGAGRGAQPLEQFFAHGGGRSVALAEGADQGVVLWTEVGPHHAARLRLDRTDPTQRLSWRETQLATLRNVYPVGKMVLTGSWSQLQTSGSGLAASYTGNRAISTGSTGASATIDVDRAESYDLWINYTGRTSGGYVKVEIDGDQSLVNEIGDPAGLGFKAFSSYSATDLKRRQAIKVASGLTGLHAVRISFGGAASPGGGAILIEAVAITGSLRDPFILPPVWEPNTPYQMGDEVQFGGVFYAARGNGTSGTSGPMHSGGIASDGALDWRADSRPTYPECTTIDYGSEREYAARLNVAGAVVEVGGQTHGHDEVLAEQIAVDGTPWVPAVGGNGLSVGAQITINETTEWQTGSGGQLAACQISRVATAGTILHTMQVDVSGTAIGVEWLYAGMLPFVPWDGEAARDVVTSVTTEDGAVTTLAGFAGQTGQQIDKPMSRKLGIMGALHDGDFVYGHEAGALPSASNRIDGFDTFVLPNIDGSSASGGTDWPAKAYVRARPQVGLTLNNGDTLGFFNRHVLSVVR